MAAFTEKEIPTDAFDAALAWAVKLRSGACDTATRIACDLWRAASPAHERAWQEIQGVEAEFGGLPTGASQISSRTLESAARQRARGRSRRKALKALGLGAVGVTAGWVVADADGWLRRATGWRADYSTATGERREFTLTDGSQLVLNTSSAVDIRFTDSERLILLHSGEIFIRTGTDTRARLHRPLRVSTAFGTLEAIGTRFTVRGEGDRVALHVEEGAVAIGMAMDAQRPIAKAGEAYLLTAAGAALAMDQALDPTAWRDGALVARQLRLQDFVAELGRYRQGWLLCDPEVAQLRVSGVFQLDDTDRALDALMRALPVKVERRTRFWARVGPA